MFFRLKSWLLKIVMRDQFEVWNQISWPRGHQLVKTIDKARETPERRRS